MQGDHKKREIRPKQVVASCVFLCNMKRPLIKPDQVNTGKSATKGDTLTKEGWRKGGATDMPINIKGETAA